MDRERIERAKKRIHLQRGVGLRKHGAVRVVLSSLAIDNLADKVKYLATLQANREAGKQIDKDFVRGGFSPNMRHAR